MPRALAAWLARLGPLAVTRPAPSLGRAVAGVGGALVAVGVVALGGDQWTSSGSSGLAIVLVGGLLAASVAAIIKSPPAVAVAGVAASGIAAPAFAFFLGASGGFPSMREVGLLAGLLLAGIYLVGPWRGHTFHFAILVVAGWVVALSFGNLGIERSLFGGFDTVGQAISQAGAASMVLGVVYLGLGSWLHDEGLEGMATPLLGVAALALPTGTFAVLRDSPDALLSLVAIAVGGAVAFVGARGRRQGTTWIGVGIAAVAIVRLAGAVSDRTAVIGLLAAAAGAGLVYLAPMAAATVHEPALPATPAGGPPATADLPVGPPPDTPRSPDPARVRRPRPTRPPGPPRSPRTPRTPPTSPPLPLASSAPSPDGQGLTDPAGAPRSPRSRRPPKPLPPPAPPTAPDEEP